MDDEEDRNSDTRETIPPINVPLPHEVDEQMEALCTAFEGLRPLSLEALFSRYYNGRQNDPGRPFPKSEGFVVRPTVEALLRVISAKRSSWPDYNRLLERVLEVSGIGRSALFVDPRLENPCPSWAHVRNYEQSVPDDFYLVSGQTLDYRGLQPGKVERLMKEKGEIPMSSVDAGLYLIANDDRWACPLAIGCVGSQRHAQSGERLATMWLTDEKRRRRFWPLSCTYTDANIAFGSITLPPKE